MGNTWYETNLYWPRTVQRRGLVGWNEPQLPTGLLASCYYEAPRGPLLLSGAPRSRFSKRPQLTGRGKGSISAQR